MSFSVEKLQLLCMFSSLDRNVTGRRTEVLHVHGNDLLVGIIWNSKL